MEEKKGKPDEPQQTDFQQSGLVDITPTEDNPIEFSTATMQDTEVAPHQNDDDDETAMMLSRLPANVFGAMSTIPARQSQQMTLHSGEPQPLSQVIPVDISGGKFSDAHIGAKTYNATKNVGIAEGDFRGAHFGPNIYTINQIAEAADGKRKSNDSSNSEQPEQKRPKDCSDLCQLSDSIWINKKLRLAKKGKVFEGVKRSGILDDQKLAIKFVWNYSERNRREAKNLLTLRPHTNVVTILHSDIFHEGQFKCMYIAMDLCSTVNLEHYIEDRKAKNVPFNVKQALEHAKQVVAAIHHIHEHNILHRDLKPTSVLFSLCGKYLKICDFGLSKELENGRSVTGLSTLKVGTDGYRAPETYNKDIISKMADIFSLALVLYYLWSYGIHPFGLDTEIWSYNIKHVKDLDLSHLRIPLSEFAKDLLGRMLKFAPKERPTIAQVKNDQFMKLDWFASLAENLVQIWSGDVKDHTGADVLPACQLYRTPELQDVVDINGSDWLFRMNTTPFVDIGSLKNLTEEKPSGYLVTSSADELKKLTKRLADNNLMAWIDINKEGGQPKVFALLYQKDYPELFGFLLPDPQILASLVKGIVSKETPSPQQPGDDETSAIDEQTANLLDQIIPSLIKPTQSAPVATEASESFQDLVDLEAAQEQQAEQAATSKSQTTEVKQISPELIPWWIFTGLK